MALPTQNAGGSIGKDTAKAQVVTSQMSQNMVSILTTLTTLTEQNIAEAEAAREAGEVSATIDEKLLSREKIKTTFNFAKWVWQRKSAKLQADRARDLYNMTVAQAKSLGEIENLMGGQSEALTDLPEKLDVNKAMQKSPVLKSIEGLIERGEVREERKGLEEIEERREGQRFNERLLAALKGLRGEAKEEEESIWAKLFTAGVLLVAAISGYIAGFISTLDDAFVTLKLFFKNTLKLGSRLKNMNNIFGKAITKIVTPMQKFGNLLKGKFLKGLDKVMGVFTKIKNFITGWSKTAGKFGKVFSFMGKIATTFGKFFLPLTILLGAFEVIKGFMKGFSEKGIIGGLLGALDGLIEFLVDTPINLLKDIGSWILRKLGFDELANSLDAFNFDLSGMISRGVEAAINWVRGMFGMGPIGSGEDVTLPEGEEEGFSFTGFISDVWNGIKTFFTEKLSWETIKEGLTTAIKWSPLGMLTQVVMAIGEWFGNLFDIDFASLGKWILDSMGSLGATVGGWLGLGEDEAPEGSVKVQSKEAEKLQDKLDTLKVRIFEQNEAIRALHDEVSRLRDARDDRRAGGGGVNVKQGDTISTTNQTAIINERKPVRNNALPDSGFD